MAEERVQRRLAAILVCDVVGYSRLMGAGDPTQTAIESVILGRRHTQNQRRQDRPHAL